MKLLDITPEVMLVKQLHHCSICVVDPNVFCPRDLNVICYFAGSAILNMMIEMQKLHGGRTHQYHD